MAGITIDGGRFNFQNKTQQQSQKKDDKEVRVLILGNFSGSEKPPSFKPLKIDKDNIEEVFSALDVRLLGPVLSNHAAIQRLCNASCDLDLGGKLLGWG